MRNFTQLALLLFLGACFFCTASVSADEIEPGTSFTDRITNPSYSTGTGTGWTIRSGATPTWKSAEHEAEVWNASFDMYQTISGLPAGTYKLTVDGLYREGANDSGTKHNDGTEEINAVVYSETPLKSKQTLLHSVYSVTDFVGSKQMLNGYVDGVVSAREAFDAGHFKDNTIDNIIVGADGMLTIGIKTLKLVQYHWIIWDNFQLFYMGPPGLAELKEGIESAGMALSEYYDTDNAPSGIRKEIEDVQAFIEGYNSNNDPEAIAVMFDSISHVKARADVAAVTMLSVRDLIEEASLLPNTYSGYSVFYAATDAIYAILEEKATVDGHLVFNADLIAAIAAYNAAIRVYRFTEPVTDSETGVDFTWAMLSPNFTKKGGDPAVAADGSSEGWKHNNIPATSAQYRLNLVNGKNCWNNWENNFTSMNVYQEFANMPAGLYSFSCYQTNNGPEMTNQHAYAAALGGTAVSPNATYTFVSDPEPLGTDFAKNSRWEGPLETAKVLVGEDGNLRVGFTSVGGTGSSGWFCITDCKLTYYGPDNSAFAASLLALIEEAGILSDDSVMLATDRAILNEGITAAKATNLENIDAITTSLEAIGTVITNAHTAINGLRTFKAGTYAKTLKMVENEEGLYLNEVTELLGELLTSIDETLEGPTLTSEGFPAINTLMTNAIDFCSTYELAYSFLNDGRYTDVIADLLIEADNQLEIVSTDFSKAETAKAAIIKAIGAMRLTGVAPGEEADVTELLIVNPTIEGSDNNVLPEGWSGVKTSGNTFSTTSQHWTGDDTNRYLDSWNGTAGALKLNVYQVINGIPNGTYKLIAATRTSGNGSYLYAKSGNTLQFTEIPIYNGDAGGIWEAAEEESELKLVNDGKGRGWTNISVEIEVNNNALTIGCTSDKGVITEGVAWTGTWFSVDDFKLFWLSELTGLEENEATPAAELIAYVTNGYITVVGVEEYTISTIDGISVPAGNQLSPGTYIVKSGELVTKVIVQ